VIVRWLRTLGRGVLTLVVFAALGGLFAFAGNDWHAPWVDPPAHGEDWCEEHGVPQSTCEKCNVELERGGTFTVLRRKPEGDECPNRLAKVTLGPGAREDVGIEVQDVQMRSISERLHANAETTYPPSRHAVVAPRVTGTVRSVEAVLGKKVEPKTVLAVVESPALGQAKRQYVHRLAMLALRQKRFDQEQGLLERKFAVRGQVLDAEARLAEAKLDVQESEAVLAGFGLLEAGIDAVASKGDTSPLVDVTAPFRGTVTAVDAELGELVGPGKPLFRIADMRRLWLAIDVYEADLPKIELDQRVTFRVDGLSRRRFRGRVVAIGGEVDERTRTVHVYAEVKNTGGLLRAKMFGRAVVVVQPKEERLVVPKEAVQDDGDCHFVFVSPKDDVFLARGVEVGTAYPRGYEILSGLRVGERVVTSGSFLLKTEILRGQMGAG